LKRLAKGLLAAAGIAAMAVVAMPASADPAIPFSNDYEDAVNSAGSDTTYFLLNDLAKAFNESEGCALNSITYPKAGADPAFHTCKPAANQAADVTKTENYDHEYVYNHFPQGSSAGRRLLCQQTAPRPAGVPYVAFSRSSASPAEGFQCPGATGVTLRFVAFAKDALTWTYWPGQSPAPATDLTQSQLNDIFVDCTITTWDQIGGEAQAIEVWTAQTASGSRAVWDSFIGGSSDSCIPAALKDGDPNNGEHVVREHDQTPVAVEVAGDDEKYSIFWASVGVWNSQTNFQAGSQIGNVEGFAPTTANIQSGDFPFSRFLYNVYRQAGPAPLASPAAAGFMGPNGWICKGEGAHSKPVGDTDPGVESATATKNYNELIKSTITDNGFILIRDTGNRCNFTDVVGP